MKKVRMLKRAEEKRKFILFPIFFFVNTFTAHPTNQSGGFSGGGALAILYPSGFPPFLQNSLKLSSFTRQPVNGNEGMKESYVPCVPLCTVHLCLIFSGVVTTGVE